VVAGDGAANAQAAGERTTLVMVPTADTYCPGQSVGRAGIWLQALYGHPAATVPKVAAVHAGAQPSQNHQIVKGVLVVVANSVSHYPGHRGGVAAFSLCSQGQQGGQGQNGVH
jgi:hypothetical protein